MDMAASDPATLLFDAHGKLLRRLCHHYDRHFEGLSQAVRVLRGSSASTKMCRQITHIETAFNMIRHVSAQRIRLLLEDLEAELGRDTEKISKRACSPRSASTAEMEATRSDVVASSDDMASYVAAFYIGDHTAEQFTQTEEVGKADQDGDALVEAQLAALEAFEKASMSCEDLRSRVCFGDSVAMAKQCMEKDNMRYAVHGVSDAVWQSLCNKVNDAGTVVGTKQLRPGDVVEFIDDHGSVNDIIIRRGYYGIVKELLHDGAFRCMIPEMGAPSPYTHWSRAASVIRHGSVAGDEAGSAVSGNGAEAGKQKKKKQKKDGSS
eukprot:TRINITY_DN100814_c0_g1_i1.p1 TRINITY_DN100814_c0_g1~~TRINITY_DN100814_c0_g1_i1.p1  ORF type:complete len:322 (+),score=68.85 TRINITY_DN100814_c0_g1_i1:38-1003(+)